MRLLLLCSLSLLLLLASPALGQTGVTAQALGQANLRADDNINSALIGEITAGTAYPVLGRSQFYPWLLLGAPGTSNPLGWVYETLVAVSGNLGQVPFSDLILAAAPAPATATATSAAHPLPSVPPDATPSLVQTARPSPAHFGVTGEVIGEVNIRYGPGIDYARVGVAQAGQAFAVTGYHTQFPWVRIYFESLPNKQAWIARDLLRISGDLFSTPAISQTRLNLPPLSPTPPAISSGGEQVPLSTGFRILADHLWNLVLESGFDPQTSRFGALFVMDLASGEAFSFGQDIAFSGTSINKIAILTALYTQLDAPPSIALATDIANTMICSENVATNRLLSILGRGNTYYGADAVSGFYEGLGWSRSFITAPFTTIGTPEPPPGPINLPQTSADQVKANPDLSNQLTVSEAGALLGSLYRCAYREDGPLIAAFGDRLEPRECRQILHVMSNNTVDALLKAGVPAGTRVAHKHGWIADTHGNAALFFTPGGDYVIAMMLYQPQWLNFQESLPLIAEVSRRVYNYFNPEGPQAEIRDGYIPDAGSCNYNGDPLVADIMQPIWPN
ncbi:MAG: serine hydrolase [Chloroflexi bacterium]|nr:serine hydrolase [Chloroflexota bacterium]